MPFDERASRLRGRRHLRDELRVRLRLPARQHGHLARRHRPAQPRLRDRGRGRLDPHRRGADAADHLRRARDRGRRSTTTSRASPRRSRACPRAGRRGQGASSPDADFVYDEKRKTVAPMPRGDRGGRARDRDREPLRPAERAARQPPDPGAQGRVAVPPRRRLRRPGRRGQDRRRVHRPDHGGPPLVRGPPPGGRGEGGRAHPGGARHARDDHAAELLPPLREARRHDRYGQDRGEGVRRDLRPARRRDPDERRGRPRSTRTTSSSRRRRRSSTRCIADIKERHEDGQPVLVGTIAVETSEYLSQLLDAHRASRTTC